MGEEAQEFIKDKNEEELTDVAETADAIIFLIEKYKLDKNKFLSVKRKKAKEKGRLREMIILEEV